MKRAPVHCRICGGEIDRDSEQENVDWIMLSKNWYYHKSCYESWKKSTPEEDKEWVHFIYDFLARDLKVQYNYWMCEKQREKFIKEKKYTSKGIFFALKYFYEVKHGDWEKSHGGLGIIPYIYNDACTYWVEQERKSNGVCEKIKEQMKAAAERKTEVVRKKTPKKKDKYKEALNLIDEMEDDE